MKLVSMAALERLVGLALDGALKPDGARWAKEQVASVFRAAAGMKVPCNCNVPEVREPEPIRRRASTNPGW